MRINHYLLAIFTLVFSNLVWCALCETALLPKETLQISTKKVLRRNVPASYFGFTVDWYLFQKGHFRMGKVRPETVEYLKPFSGAIYRYSGGNDFPWKNAVGPITKRKWIKTNFEGMKYPEFGPGEFFDFLKGVDGKAVVLLDVARLSQPQMDAQAMLDDELGYIAWLAENGPKCLSGDNCRISYFELGNEVDTEKGLEWSAEYYFNRINPLIDSAKKIDRNIHFAVTGKTAPWGGLRDSSGTLYDQRLATRIANKIDAVTFHPYYDGLPIPSMNENGSQTLKNYLPLNSKVKLLVTEHGRWPDIPKVGNWENNWYQASGSGGALSSADYILSLLNDQTIAGAMWHSIAVESPWQLFHLNKENDSIYPSAVYWGLRVLRDGFLTDSIKVDPAFLKGKSYISGYDVRLNAMKNAKGDVSILGVNRGEDRWVKIRMDALTMDRKAFNLSYLQADEIGNDNTAESPMKFQPKYYKSTFKNDEMMCIPARSVFSIGLNL
jgi:alpha-N-arabinofuranosidase